MSTYARIPLLTLSILSVAFYARAGRNDNGAILVHTNDAYDYSSGTVCSAPESAPGTCEEANTMASRMQIKVIWLLAAFPETSDPCVRVVYFGIDYDDANLDPGAGNTVCGPEGTIEIPDDGWPHTGRGNSVAFPDAVTFLGYDGFGYPAYKLEHSVSVSVTGAETTWFSYQAADHPFPPQWGRLGTGDVLTNCESLVRSAYFGFWAWTPAPAIVGGGWDAAQEFECGSEVPVKETTWGAIKALFR